MMDYLSPEEWGAQCPVTVTATPEEWSKVYAALVLVGSWSQPMLDKIYAAVSEAM